MHIRPYTSPLDQFPRQSRGCPTVRTIAAAKRNGGACRRRRRGSTRSRARACRVILAEEKGAGGRSGVVSKDAVPFHGGTGGSNPACSSGESANHRFRDRLPFSGPRGFADANIAAWRPEPRQP